MSDAQFFSSLGALVGAQLIGILALVGFVASRVERRADRLEDRLEHLEQHIGDRFDDIDGRIHATELTLARVDERLAHVETDLREHTQAHHR